MGKGFPRAYFSGRDSCAANYFTSFILYVEERHNIRLKRHLRRLELYFFLNKWTWHFWIKLKKCKNKNGQVERQKRQIEYEDTFCFYIRLIKKHISYQNPTGQNKCGLTVGCPTNCEKEEEKILPTWPRNQTSPSLTDASLTCADIWRVHLQTRRFPHSIELTSRRAAQVN